MIKKYDFEKLLHDLKRISRVIPLIKEAEDKIKRESLIDLLTDELDRLYSDLKEIKNLNGEE